MKNSIKCVVMVEFMLFMLYFLVNGKKILRKSPERVTIDVSGSVVESKEVLLSQVVKDITYPTVSKHIFSGLSINRQVNVEIKQIERCISTIASAQSAWKSMDGATHQFKSTFKSSITSLHKRYQRFINRKSRNTKEAAKIMEYINAVERGMQSAEILQSLQQKSVQRRTKFLSAAGLEPVFEFTVTIKKIPLKVSLLRPLSTNSTDGRFATGEMLIILNDEFSSKPEKTTTKLLSILAKSKTVSARIRGSQSFVLSVLEGYYNVSEEILKQLEPYLVTTTAQQPVTSELNPNNHNNNSSNSSAVIERSAFAPLASSIRVIGYSSGAPAAAYLSMFLDGFLIPTSATNSTLVDSDVDSTTSEIDSPLFGLYRRRVRCLTLGCPPCLSREVIPSFITSVICGDDMMCRAQRDSLRDMSKKVIDRVNAGMGQRGLGWITGASMLTELSSTAQNQLGKYKGRKKDKHSLQVPGRVFFIKSRQLKQGATIQRVLRGNWQEDVLWNIRDIVLSPKMLDHHTLDAYIRTLNRC